LPPGWITARIEDIFAPLEDGRTLHQGWSPQCRAVASDSDTNWGVLKTTAIQPGRFESEHNKSLPSDLSPRPHLEVHAGDMLITCAGPRARCGVACLVKSARPRLMMSGKMYRFRLPDDHIDSRFVEAYLQTTPAWDEIDGMKTGGSDSGLNLTHYRFRTLGVPVAPLNEQRRIVEAYEELVSDLDAGVAALERVREKLKLYRAVILKAAVEGTLTAEWRAQHPNTEPASEFLQRILVEHRRCWEQKQLAKFKTKGQEPPENWKAKYKEPVTPDTTNPLLPEGWCCATVNQCSALIQYGSSSKTNEDTQGIAVLRMVNLRSDGNLVLDELKYLPINHEEFPDLLLAPGDLLFNRTNSSELVGKTGLYKGYPAPCSFASYLIRVRVLDGVLPSVVKYSLNGSLGRQWIKDVVNQTVGQANVNGTKLAGFVFPLPPLVEQEAIVQAVEDQLSIIDHLEAELATKLKSAKVLRQSILRHAFTGQLVPQDPNDEPASELLKRIAAERAARARESAAAKREANPSNGSRTGRRGRPKKNTQGTD
jgi:type I restriction enzyme, S subunit